jgi:hypothetical protein
MTLPQCISAQHMLALQYEAPFLIEKLLKDHIVESPEEGQALFAEVKKYLVLVESDSTIVWQMYSLRIDEVWHQFILFTREYTDFCERFFGTYLGHSPSNAPETKTVSPTEVSSLELFTRRYEKLFGTPPPEAWYDGKSVTMQRRVLTYGVGVLSLRDAGAMIDLVTPSGKTVLSVNEVGRSALKFIAQTGAFYVRELPGDLNDEEKVALVATLVECQVLRLAA